MTDTSNRWLLKGLEEEVYTGTDDGRIVGLETPSPIVSSERSERPADALFGFRTEPDRRNPEFSLPPLRSYDEIGSTLVQTRLQWRQQLKDLGNYTLIPGATMSLGDSTVFLISDPDNDYYNYIRDAYGTGVVTTSTHISIGLNDSKTIVRAARLLRAEACLFLALTAASPFLDGVATGHHSTRWMIFPQTPVQTPLFESPASYETFVDDAIADGRMQNNRHLWISARPNGPVAPTRLNRVELRICDHIYDPRIVLAVTALVESRIHELLSDPSLDPLKLSELPKSTRADALRQLIVENEAAVAKDSLDATVRHWRDGRRQPVRQWLESYYAQALSTAHVHGFDRSLWPLRQIIDEGNVAMSWLKLFNQGVTVPEIMEQSITRMQETEMLYVEEASTRKTTRAGAGGSSKQGR